MDRFPAFKLFYRVEEKVPCELLAPPLRCPVRHAGNGNESLFSTGFIIPGDVRAATSVELRMLNSPTKMDDPNNGASTAPCVAPILQTNMSETQPHALTQQADSQVVQYQMVVHS
ncbi:hypothetical protein CRENBAI_017445 [Crenichthys baileyi]|uniref:Uncharacterized protein n=1 Tax=Crenichthys baileyi TaxID=28760 RepID=A0AAV9R3T0_9TELE